MSSKLLRSVAVLGVVASVFAVGCASEIADNASDETESDLTAAGQAMMGAYEGQGGPFQHLVLTAVSNGSANQFFAEVDTGVRCFTTPCPSSARIDGTFTATKRTITLKSSSAPDLAKHLLGKYSYTLEGGKLTLTRKGVDTSTLERGDSYCQQPADCAGQAIMHPMCVGHWLCTPQQTCGYACGVSEIPQ